MQTVYFTQEEYKDENKSEVTLTMTEEPHLEKLSQAGSHREQRMLQAIKRSQTNLHIDQQTMMSKTSI